MLGLLLAAAIRIDPHVLARFDPRTSLGATIDVHESGETATVFTKANIEAMRSAGFHPLSYRLATELAGEAWHWNPRGTWSGDGEGYWTSSADARAPIEVSYGYRLPRRGNTRDQVANDGYSRIDDGDRSTFWKSNPYLHNRPQWILLDLGRTETVDRVAIEWGEPHATQYEIQVWRGEDPIEEPHFGFWAPMHESQRARYLRVWMTESAMISPSADWRDNTGFAIREISVLRGSLDLVRHVASSKQTVIWVSSTDPWHRATDIDRDMEQLGLDRVFASGLTNGLPMLTPVALLYSIPEDAAAEVAYLRRYDVKQIEMGEEPDGQLVAPEDYAELYRQWAEAIHRVDPSLQLGGPALQSTRDVVAFWPDERGETSWMKRFLAHVDRRDFNFFSFEWYPFDDVCIAPEKNLAAAQRILDRVLGRWRREGVPQDIPWIASEYGWSSYAAKAEVEMPGAIFDAEFVADFLARGGSAAYIYGLEPARLIREKCNQWGALTLMLGEQKVPAFYAAQLVTQKWLLPEGIHELHAITGARGYAVKRPDGTWALLLFAIQPQSVQVQGEVFQYGGTPHPAFAHPLPASRGEGLLRLPAWSISVVLLGTQDGVAGRVVHR